MKLGQVRLGSIMASKKLIWGLYWMLTPLNIRNRLIPRYLSTRGMEIPQIRAGEGYF